MNKWLSCPCCGLYNATPALTASLDKMGAAYGRPLIVNSACRCEKHNNAVGGKSNSEHLIGCGADIHAPNSQERFFLLGAAINAGFRRIGIGSTYIHVGVSKNHPQGVIWLYP